MVASPTLNTGISPGNLAQSVRILYAGADSVKREMPSMPANDSKPRLKAPAGTCDTHMHFYDKRYPIAPTAKILAPDALVPEYMKMRQRLGIERTIVVQPSAYGSDNRCTMDAVAAIGPSARAVVVVEPDVSDAELERLTKLGARGLRFFMLSGAPLPWESLEALSARVAPFGWHVVFQMDGRDLADRADMLKRFASKVIIDHTGKFLEPVALDHPGFRTILNLLDGGRTWLKLAAPYETSKVGPPNYDDVGKLAKAAAKAAPERMLWASNWPHPSATEKPDDAWMLDMLLDWIPDEAARKKALVDNPAELYGF
jgi:D-galactarolactone isomerase